MSFCIKEHKFGVFLALGRDTEKLFPLTCRGGESRAKEELSGVMIMSSPGESGKHQPTGVPCWLIKSYI